MSQRLKKEALLWKCMLKTFKLEIMIIKPGERIPLDGEVLSGDSTIDTKILTGESVPVNVTKR